MRRENYSWSTGYFLKNRVVIELNTALAHRQSSFPVISCDFSVDLRRGLSLGKKQLLQEMEITGVW